ncbi:MAG: STAS domain-containing protein [Thermoleophilia bacterium]|jgi:anti-anti-sigma factor
MARRSEQSRNSEYVELHHSVERHGDTAVIYVTGVVDFATAPLLRRDIDDCAAGDATRVELHLGHIELMDSSGLGTLIHAYKLFGARGKELVFLGSGPVVTRLLERTSLDRFIKIVPETESCCLEERPAHSA